MTKIRSSVFAVAILAGAVHAQDLFRASRFYGDDRNWRLAADVDGDGDIDLVGARVNGLLVLWTNDGSGSFTPATIGTVPVDWTGAIAAGDFDGDSRKDVALGVFGYQSAGPGVVIFAQTPAGFAPPSLVGAPGGVTWMRASDINADGVDDLLVAMYPCTASSCAYFAATFATWIVSGPGGLTAVPEVPLPGGAYVSTFSLVAFDANGDGGIDLVRHAPAGNTLIALVSVGSSLQPGPTFPLGTSAFGSSPVATDVDGDGDDDLVTISAMSGSYGLRVHRNLGGFSFSSLATGPQSFPQGFGGPRLYAGDWDGDGKPEILARSEPTENPVPSMDLLYRNDGTGVFTPGGLWPVGGGTPPAYLPGEAGFADIDNDGRDDFVGSTDLIFADGTFDASVQTTPGLGTGSLFDLDRDGDPDYLMGGSNAYWFSNDGTGRADSQPPGNFSHVPAIATPYYLSSSLLLDLDADGWIDELAFVASNVGPPECRTYRGSADGRLTFLAPTFTVPGVAVTPLRALVADFDQDGRPDLALDQGIGYALGTGSHALGLGAWTGFQVRGTGDVDADGDPDVLVTATQLPTATVVGQLGWFRNLDGYAFQPVIAADPATVSASPVLGDADGDGDLDLVYLRAPGSNAVFLVILENVAGAFGATTVIPVAPMTPFECLSARCFVGDLDLDGFPDVGVFSRKNAVAGRASFCRGAGTGFSFRPFVQYTLHYPGAIVDIDGDGDLDAVGDGLNRNPHFRGAAGGSRRQYGAGNAGTGGIAPVLGATGPFRTGSAVVLRARRFLGGAPALLTIGSQGVNLPAQFLPSVTTYVWPWTGTIALPPTLAPPIAGEGRLDLGLIVPPSFANQSFYLQFAFADPAAPHGITATNGLEIRVGL